MPLLKRGLALIRDLREVIRLPTLTVNLMHAATAGNDPFYGTLVSKFYRASVARHPRCPLFPRFTHGVATCVLPATHDEYFLLIAGSARRNYKKAVRTGYTFSRIDYNCWLKDVCAIHRSTCFRQGPVPRGLFEDEPPSAIAPVSATSVHDYLYFGVQRDGVLYAYASCFIAGELCLLERIFGHAQRHGDGIVPMLIISIAKHVLEYHPTVGYYAYGTYYGARESMRRFKTKFRFNPCRIDWRL
jgi:hypothetical protein